MAHAFHAIRKVLAAGEHTGSTVTQHEISIRFFAAAQVMAPDLLLVVPLPPLRKSYVCFTLLLVQAMGCIWCPISGCISEPTFSHLNDHKAVATFNAEFALFDLVTVAGWVITQTCNWLPLTDDGSLSIAVPHFGNDVCAQRAIGFWPIVQQRSFVFRHQLMVVLQRSLAAQPEQ